MARLDVYSDVICPWCYIGKQHMQTALRALEADELRFEVGWRPFQLNPDMPPQGMKRDEYRRAKFGSLERSRQLDGQVAEAARAAGLEIHHDRMQRTPNTLDAHRLRRDALDAHGLRRDALDAHGCRCVAGFAPAVAVWASHRAGRCAHEDRRQEGRPCRISAKSQARLSTSAAVTPRRRM